MIEELKELDTLEILENVDLKDYTTFKVSCIADFLAKPKNEQELCHLLDILKQKEIRYKVLGKGSNVIFVQPKFEGVIISLEYFQKLKREGNKFHVGAGYSLMKLALDTANLGYTGLEFASGIPGSVGGSLVNNAGAYGSSMSNVVHSVKVLLPNHEIKVFTKEELSFCYRSSFLQYKTDYICLEVTFVLEEGCKEEIMDTIKRRREKRMETQPLDFPSAGSVFRNPEGNSAWKYIDALGFKGRRIGGAEVSRKHANFIINVGNATGRDIKTLILEIKEAVEKEFGISLVYEQELVE